MLKVLKNSFFGSIILNIWNFFVNSYNNSVLSKNVLAVATVFKESKLFKLLSAYVNKSPYYENSLVFKMVMGVVSLIDKLMAVLNKAFTCMISGSVFCKAVMEIYNGGRSAQALSLVAMGVCLGFAFCGSVIGVIGAVVFLITAFIGSGNALKSCVVYRFICWLVKA